MVNIGNLHLFFELFLWNIDIHELLFQEECFPRKSGLSVWEDISPKKSVQ